ncbi:uncharacterized protein LOC134752997 [Cydia strobilella]|uniref:uncharacterized protein LOC134752997 n=1 Tax=Cydia strobilella TaxID=1100964 RepID=UPI0030053548
MELRVISAGTEIIDDLVKKCSPHFKQSGYSDITVQASVIENTCSSANGDNVDWDGNNNGGSTESNTGGNTKGSTESSTSGSTGSKTEGSTEGNTGGSTEGSTGSSTGKNTGDNTGVSVGVNLGLGEVLNGIFKVINGVANTALSALDACVNIVIRTLKDVFDVVGNLILVLQVALNNLVSGLGSLFVRLVACIIKIAVCVLGLPGDSAVRAKGWNARFGVEGELSVDATAEAYVKLFGLVNAKAELDGYIKIISGGKEIEKTSGSINIVLNRVNTLCDYITNYKQISKETVTQTFVIMTTVAASISNSRKTNFWQ